jgi:uncharacterized phage protein gp47/JayE
LPSPDLRAYHELTLYDRQPSELVDRAVSDAVVKLPAWQPRDGNTEMVMIEALALVVAELAYAINRVPGAVMDVLLRLYEIERGLGSPATATVTFELANTLGHTIPAGTTVRLDLGGGETLDFTTDAEVLVAVGVASVDVAVTAVSNTADANGTAAGTVLDMVSAVPFVNRALLATAVAAGADPETEESWRNRGIQRFSRLVSTLVKPAHFTADALEFEQVFRATTLDQYDPGQVGSPGDHAGHVTVAVLGSGGALVSAADKTMIEADLDAKAQANLAVHVADPTITDVDVSVTVKALPGYTVAQVQEAVGAALGSYLAPDTWAWGTTVRRNELIALIDQAAGVDYVDTLTTPAGDVALAGHAPLARLGAATVTVV